MLVIHRARDCDDTDLYGFLSEMNILLASVYAMELFYPSIPLGTGTGQLEGHSGNAGAFTWPLIVFSQMQSTRSVRYLDINSSKSNELINVKILFYTNKFGHVYLYLSLNRKYYW